MRKLKLTLEYDGTGYAGWQVQNNADTVQGRVEAALGEVLREKVRIHGAGRTDAGVHALGQVAHFETASALPAENILKGANTHLPPDIVILEAAEADPDFHARYSARGKIYRYRVLLRNVRSPLARFRALRVAPPLDREKMRAAAKLLTGRHDFAAFAAAGSSVKDTVRNLTRLEVKEEDVGLTLEFRADGFLYRMVRNLVGTLLEVGKGNLTVEEVSGILHSRDRKQAGPTALACGLYLVKVRYGE
ncbi:MAG: tRNA pseudouridine(38-40) synthase TruA [Candidatus Erginobacter occultus]|nr:tRNA pseudouridine(38-40) synthase TruA [Candidatus Erginobacter occultus]